jgi:hypothetical protein
MLNKKLSKLKDGTVSLPVGFLNVDKAYDLSTLKFTYFDFDTF